MARLRTGLLLLALGAPLAGCGDDTPTEPDPATSRDAPRGGAPTAPQLLAKVDRLAKELPSQQTRVQLRSYARHDDAAVRERAAHALALHAVAARSEEPERLAKTLRDAGLVPVGPDLWLTDLAALLRDPAPAVRSRVMAGFARVLHTGKVELPMTMLLENLEAAPADVQIEILHVIRVTGERAMGLAEPLRILMDPAQKVAQSTQVRLEAALAHHAVTGVAQPATDVLTELLEDKDPGVRQMAAHALALHPVPHETRIRLLLPLLDDEDPGVADHAAISLVRAEGDTPEVRKRVRDIADTPDNPLRALAQRALEGR